ncbi:hypothetical protein QQX10_10390 [Demequina sp. SYSU T00039]|uniref:Htaa protein n=1 Tax=Demequina lignilytica TaxID=3051663 RepID=A0AAW7M4Y5_9MICO|nr:MULTISPECIES: hypothetical protein [unclassified Demequina]MDN4478597.1 hypothetical protein [Demequina sp. SYSU T00039-1]MDN4488575.1 hypothetical protein [Demequina sp. SYSU T00039]MDN4491601.1 hypothetical protein [Demequina sp. SYSU T00068]
MVKLSDALRGAADKAPLDGMSIDRAHATRRASRSRALHAGANGLLGAGAVALIAVGVIGPGSALGSRSEDSATTAESATDSAGGDMSAGVPETDGGLAAGSLPAWGMCGTELPAMPEIAGPFSLAASLPTGEVAGGTLDVVATLTSAEDGVFETFEVDGVVLWDGIVVATLGSSTDDVVEIRELVMAAGDSEVTELSVPLENCWDGEALPAGKYEVVLTQELWPSEMIVEEEPPSEPTLEPADPVEPTDAVDEPAPAEPTDDVAVDPDEAVTSGPADGDAATTTDSAGMLAADAFTRVYSDPVGFAVPGEPVDEPFAAYLRTDPEPVPDPVDPTPVDPTSDSALDAATARELYLAGLTGAWDMAAGSQRWLATSDGLGEVPTSWWGCGYEGDGAFPARSAELDLLSVTVAAPRSISVSYGWIVEGNPAVDVTLANTSEWDLTQFWGMQGVNLALVRDGRVVAEGYPVDPYQHQRAWAMDSAAAMEEQAFEDTGDAAVSEPALGEMTIAPEWEGSFLGAGESVSSTYLWRDVSTCWTEAGQLDVAPGSYTLLAMHHLSLPGTTIVEPTGDDGVDLERGSDGGIVVTEPDAGWGVEGSAGTTGSGESSIGIAEPDIAIAPEPGYYDWFELQAWTSLGTVTVR